MILEFTKKPTGKTLFYPANKAAADLVAAFVNSRGKRKCITEDQLVILLKSGVYCKVKQSLDKNLQTQ